MCQNQFDGEKLFMYLDDLHAPKRESFWSLFSLIYSGQLLNALYDRFCCSLDTIFVEIF
jgi:hypothetical protein